MAVRIPTAAQNAAANAVGDRADAGAGPGEIEIRSGSQPANANAAATGTLLATFTLNDPAWSGPTNGVKTLDISPAVEAVGVADANAGWFRMLDSDGNTVLDGSVTVTGDSGDLTLNTIAVSTGLDLTITGGTLTMPAG